MLPIDFLDMMRQQLGSEAENLFQALNTEPVTSIRLNDKKDVLTFDCDTDGVPWNIDGYYLSQRPMFTLDPLFHAGCYYVQEASSMFLEEILEQFLSPDSVVLDLCAAPGGKATILSQYIGSEGLLVANEINRQRVFVLSENIQKWGNGNTIVTHNTPADFGERCRNLFDCILVDAPCSGEGMFRKDMDARSEWSLRQVQLCAERQRSILMDVWDALKPGGLMIYSTCTFNEQENEQNVLWLAECLGTDVLPVQYDSTWGIVEGQVGCHFYPHRVKGEGLYICALRKHNESYAPFKVREGKSRNMHTNNDFDKVMRTWLKHPDEWAIRIEDRFMIAYPMRYKALIEYLNNILTCVSTGFGIGEERGRYVVPQHSLSMVKDLKQDAFPVVSLSLEQALAYLRTEALALTDLPLGSILLKYDDVPVGFAKNVGTRLNNLYPNEWRIRHL